MKPVFTFILASFSVVSTPLAAATIPSELIGETAVLDYAYSAQITSISDTAFFGVPTDPLPEPDPLKTPYFGISEGDTVSGTLTLEVTFQDGFVDVASATCVFGGFDCGYDSFVAYELNDIASGSATFNSTDFTNGTSLRFGMGQRSEIVSEWTDTGNFTFRSLTFEIQNISVAGLPPVASAPIPASLSFLLSMLLVLGSVGFVRRRIL